MKTTLDLPDHLVRQVKQRALQEGRTLRALVAEYIQQGLHGGSSGSGPAPSPGVQLEQECLAQEDRRRAGLSA
ncbi:MAG: hypothetical protein R6W06_12015 [Prochlorococcaceae cyanobacterium]